MTVKVGQETVMCIQIYEWIKNRTELEGSCFHFANEGKRSYFNASMLKKMGFKAGASDYFFSRPNKAYSGLWIEVKDSGKKPTKVQRDFMNRMLMDGYYATWFDSVDAVIACIKDFYSIEDLP